MSICWSQLSVVSGAGQTGRSRVSPACRADLMYTRTIEITKSTSRTVEAGLKRYSRRDVESVKGLSLCLEIASVPRAERLNLHRRRLREGRGFVQPRSVAKRLCGSLDSLTKDEGDASQLEFDGSRYLFGNFVR